MVSFEAIQFYPSNFCKLTHFTKVNTIPWIVSTTQFYYILGTTQWVLQPMSRDGIVSSDKFMNKMYSFKYQQGGSVVHCAVKTVNEQAGLKQRIEFLREASAMKDCK